MSEEKEKVYQILELGKHIKNLHHKKGFGGLLFIDLSMIKFSKLSSYIRRLDKENQELKEKLSKIETLIINHNCDTGDIYYKYNSRFLKSELKQRILEIVYEEESDSDE